MPTSVHVLSAGLTISQEYIKGLHSVLEWLPLMAAIVQCKFVPEYSQLQGPPMSAKLKSSWLHENVLIMIGISNVYLFPYNVARNLSSRGKLVRQVVVANNVQFKVLLSN
eukprot:403365473